MIHTHCVMSVLSSGDVKPLHCPLRVWSSDPGELLRCTQSASSVKLCTIPQMLMFSKVHWSNRVRLEAKKNTALRKFKSEHKCVFICLVGFENQSRTGSKKRTLTAVVHPIQSNDIHLTKVQVLPYDVEELWDVGRDGGDTGVFVESEWAIVHYRLVIIRRIQICDKTVIVFVEVMLQA